MAFSKAWLLQEGMRGEDIEKESERVKESETHGAVMLA